METQSDLSETKRYFAIALICGAGLLGGCSVENAFQTPTRAAMDDDVDSSIRTAMPQGNFRVSVTSGGKPVNDFQERLVHRVTLSKKDLAAIMPVPGRAPQVPFTGRVEKDGQGGIVGLKLTEVRTSDVLPTFGLQDGDLITAVGKKHPNEISDLSQIVLDIRKNSEATLTLQRNGKPHKIFYGLK